MQYQINLDIDDAGLSKIYGAGQVTFADAARKQLEQWNRDYGSFPVCMAKTQMSFSADPNVKGAPSGHTLNVREVRLANGAGFVVAICGDIRHSRVARSNMIGLATMGAQVRVAGPATLVPIADTSHYIQVDQPAKVIDLLAGLLPAGGHHPA